MLSALEWVLVGIVAYLAIVFALRTRGYLPEYVHVSGPIITLHTRRGKQVLGWLARPKRLWRAWGNFGIGIALVVMAGTFFATLFIGYVSLTNPPEPTAVTEPRNILVIPGFNDFLPLSVAPELIAGLLIGLVVHEAGHGLFCRVGNVDIDSMGLAFLSFIPMGAFVGPDEESVSEADRGTQTRMFAAGVTNNFAIGAIALLLLFGPVIASFSVVAGVPVGDTRPGSPALDADIDSGDVITAVDGQPVANESEFQAVLADADPTAELDLRDDSRVRLERRVHVYAAAEDAPVARNDTITAVNGTTVGTEREFRAAVENRSVAVLSRANGPDVTTAIGAYVRVDENGSLANAGAPPGSVAIVTAVDGERIRTLDEFQAVIQDAQAGQSLDVVASVDGERSEYTLTVPSADAPAEERLRFVTASGTSGFSVDDVGLEAYPAGVFLDALGGDAPVDTIFDSLSFLWLAAFFIVMPLVGAVPGLGIGYNFPGFNGIATNFYVADGALGMLGTGGAFLVANVLFWTAWINILVGQFNLFPMYPLDGGHILRTCTESVVSRLPISDRRRVTTTVTLAVSFLMLASLAMAIIGPRLLA